MIAQAITGEAYRCNLPRARKLGQKTLSGTRRRRATTVASGRQCTLASSTPAVRFRTSRPKTNEDLLANLIDL